MHRSHVEKFCTMVLVWATLASALAAAVSAAEAPDAREPTSVVVPEEPAATPSGEPAAAGRSLGAMGKIAEGLRESVTDAPDGYVDVVVHSRDIPALGRLLEGLGAAGYDSGDGSSGRFSARPWGAVGELASLAVRVPAGVLPAIAAEAHVAFIDGPSNHEPATVRDPVWEEERTALQAWAAGVRDGDGKDPIRTMGAGTSASPTSWAVAREHKAYDVWQLGYEGQGVNVAVIDTGEDFGHPSLQGQWATAPAGSAWEGWPIMAHLASMEALMGAGGWTASNDQARRPLPFWERTYDGDSWYTNTDYRVNDANGDGYIPYADGTPDPVTARPQYTPQTNPQGYGSTCGGPNTALINRQYYVGNASDPNRIPSASGLYRLGVHRDDTLTGIYCAKVGILLVDAAVAGRYDTAYVDLNFDLNFTNDKPVTKADPIAVADVTGDGVADLSGGLLYFIASSTPITGEIVIASTTGAETEAYLQNGWVAVDIDGWNRFTPPVRLRLDNSVNPLLYVPSVTEVIYEEYTAVGNYGDSGVTWRLGGPLTTLGPINTVTGQSIDAGRLLRGATGPDYALEEILEVRGSVHGLLQPLLDYDYNYELGSLTWWMNSIGTFDVGEKISIRYRIRSYQLELVSGMLQFLDNLPVAWRLLADYDTGLPIPYSQVWGPSKGYDTFIPANGDLVAFHGEFDDGQSHGTFVTSTIVARPFGNLVSPYFEVFGTAPKAKVIGIAACCNVAGPLEIFASIEDQRTFAAVGYDGVPGTGDEAAILSNSFGDKVSIETGFTREDRWLYDFWTKYPGTTTFASLGDNGMGYGTGTPGGTSVGVIGVGAGTSSDYRVLYGMDMGNGYWEFPDCPGPPPIDPADCVGVGASSGDGPGPYGEIAGFSSRGPTLLGSPKPDIVSIGSAGVEAGPLNVQSFFNWMLGLCPTFPDGNCAFDVFSGTSQATPVTAGIAALAVQAYRATHGGADPTNNVLRSALKSGADDMHRDILQQGAGWTDALRTVRMMTEADGVSSSLTHWTPGGYEGVARPAFVNFLDGGESETATITLTNHHPTAGKTVQIRDAVYERAAAPFRWNFNLGTGTAQTYVLKADGVYAQNGQTLLQAATFAPQWDTADFVKLTLAYDVNAYAGSTSLRLIAFDWYDEDGNGVYAGTGERNLMTASMAGDGANSVWDTIQRVGTKVHDGLVLNPRSGASATIPATLVVEFYEKANWSWVTEPAALTIAAGSRASFDATISVPVGTAGGMYEGALYVEDGADTLTIPILVNVPAPGGFPLVLGGNVPETSLYNNDGVVQGSRSTYPWRQTGDSRYVWGHVTAVEKTGRRMIYQAMQVGPRSDPELFVFDLQTDAAWTDDAVFGPGTMSTFLKTDEVVGDTGTLYPNREFFQRGFDLGGLVALQIKAWNANGEVEVAEGNVGIMQLTPTRVETSSSRLASSTPISVWANVPLYDGLAAASTVTTTFYKLDVMATKDYCRAFPTCSDGTDYFDWLARQRTPNSYPFQVATDTVAVNVHISSKAEGDNHDLGIWKDEDLDGIVTGADTFIAYSARSDANETIYLKLPAVGQYLAQVGIFRPGSDTFTIVIDTDTLGQSPFFLANAPTTTIPACTPIAPGIGWDLPGSTPEGNVSGGLFISPGYVPFEFVLGVNIVLRYDTTPPVVVPDLDMSPKPDSVIGDPRTPVVANAADNAFGELDRNSAQLLVDGVDVTKESRVSAPYSTAADPTPPKYTLVTVAWEHPNQPFIDGYHSAVFNIRDFAGNLNSIVWNWRVDSTPPAIAIVEPAESLVVNAPQRAFEARTEPGASVTLSVNGVLAAATVFPEGKVTATLALVEGTNDIAITCADDLGNEATAHRAIVLDTEGPVVLARFGGKTPTNKDTMTISGTVSEEVASVWVGGIEAPVAADGTFAAVVPLVEGENQFVIETWDAAANHGQVSLPVIVKDTVAPRIVLDPLPGIVTDPDEQRITISGLLEDPDLFYLKVNGQSVRPNGTTHRFTADFYLAFGANVFTVVAKDDADNVASVVFSVSFSPVIVEEHANYNGIIASGVAVVLLIVGFVVGYLLSGREEPPEGGLPEEEAVAEAPEAEQEAEEPGEAAKTKEGEP